MLIKVNVNKGELDLSSSNQYIQKVDNIDANLTITLKDLTAKVSRANLNSNSLVKNGKVLFNFFNKELYIEGVGKDKVKNLINIYDKDFQLNIFEDDVLKNIQGDADGNFKIQIDLKDSNNYKNDFLMKSKGLTTFLEKNNIKMEEGTATLNITEKDLKFSLNSLIDKAKAKIDGNLNFSSKSGKYLANIDSIDYSTVDKIIKGGLKDIIDIYGNISSNITIAQQIGDRVDFIIDANLKNTKLVAPYIRLNKAIGKDASLKFKMTYHNHDNFLELKELKLVAEEHEISIGEIDYYLDDVHIILKEVVYNENSIINSIEVIQQDNEKYITMDGEKIFYDDFNWLGFTKGEEEYDERSKNQKIFISGKNKKLLFKNGRGFDNLIIDIECKCNDCQLIRVKSEEGDIKSKNDYVEATIAGDKISLITNNSGILLTGTNVTEYIQYGGKLTLNGYLSEYKTKSGTKAKAIQATANIESFNMKGAPIIAKILSLASFTGLFYAFSGKGVHFDHFTTNFVLFDDHITFAKTIAEGGAMGIIFEGNLSFGDEPRMKLFGSLAPMNMINTVTRKIPLVGRLLVGTRGNGFFTANFELNGLVSNPSIKVNPASFFTPYAVKQIFESKE